MATAAGRRDWLTDPRFEKYADRRMNWDQFVDEFEAWSRTLTVKECVAALEKHGVPCSPYLTVTEALKDPQVAHRGSLCTIEDSAGTYQSPAPPFRFSGSPLQERPQGRQSRRAHRAACWPKRASAPTRSRPSRGWKDQMIDPRTPILVGCGQITDIERRTVERALAGGLLRRGGACSRWKTRGATIGGHTLGHEIDAIAVMEFFSDISPRFASPFGRSSNPPQERRRSAARPPAAAALQPFRRQHAPVSGQPLRRGDCRGETELALICGAELLRITQNARKAGLTIDWNEDPGGVPERVGDNRFGFSDEEARHELRAAIHFYPLLENAIRGGLKRDVPAT